MLGLAFSNMDKIGKGSQKEDWGLNTLNVLHFFLFKRFLQQEKSFSALNSYENNFPRFTWIQKEKIFSFKKAKKWLILMEIFKKGFLKFLSSNETLIWSIISQILRRIDTQYLFLIIGFNSPRSHPEKFEHKLHLEVFLIFLWLPSKIF